MNEKFAPELLESKPEVIECVVEQLDHMVGSPGWGGGTGPPSLPGLAGTCLSLFEGAGIVCFPVSEAKLLRVSSLSLPQRGAEVQTSSVL